MTHQVCLLGANTVSQEILLDDDREREIFDGIKYSLKYFSVISRLSLKERKIILSRHFFQRQTSNSIIREDTSRTQFHGSKCFFQVTYQRRGSTRVIKAEDSNLGRFSIFFFQTQGIKAIYTFFAWPQT